MENLFVGNFYGLFIVFGADLIPLLFFPKDVSLNPDSLKLLFFGQIVLYTIINAIESVELLGEELGWMGFLYSFIKK